MIGHSSCLHKLVITCPKTLLPPKQQVFGVKLDNDNRAPELMIKCINEIEKRGFKNIKGIYQIHGNRTQVTRICSSFESGSQLVDLNDSNCHDIANVVKIFLNAVIIHYTLYIIHYTS